MLSANSSPYLHYLQNFVLIVLSLVFLPLDTLIAIVALASNGINLPSAVCRRNAARQDRSFRQKNVLVTGVGMNKGLTLARLFHESGHKVIGADFDPRSCGRVSRSLQRFYVVRKPEPNLGPGPYIECLLDIIEKEQIDLWVSCSGVASAVEDGEAKEVIEARTSCKAIQFDVASTQLLHEKHTFIEHTKSLGLVVPETHAVTNSESALVVLREASRRKYIMKPTGMDDANRGDMTLLPKSTMKETEEHLSKLEISEGSLWILQQFLDGPEYCTHALVINGAVKAFVACPSTELLMHYEALPPNSPLNQQMLRFTRKFAARQGCNFSGHLSFDFLLDTTDSEQILYPIECNPRAHTAVVLFNGTQEMVDAYLSILEPSTASQVDGTADDNIRTSEGPIIPRQSDKYYWIGHDVVTRLLRPLVLLSTFSPEATSSMLLQNTVTLLEHMLFWRDGTFERWDPMPWWWLYHVYWPVQFWRALRSGTKWSRINVSTTKMFRC